MLTLSIATLSEGGQSAYGYELLDERRVALRQVSRALSAMDDQPLLYRAVYEALREMRRLGVSTLECHVAAGWLIEQLTRRVQPRHRDAKVLYPWCLGLLRDMEVTFRRDVRLERAHTLCRDAVHGEPWDATYRSSFPR